MMAAIDLKRSALSGLTTAVCLCTAVSSAHAPLMSVAGVGGADLEVRIMRFSPIGSA
jgi:hypothetical protein